MKYQKWRPAKVVVRMETDFSRMGPKPLILTFYEQLIACERMCLMLSGSKGTFVWNISDSIRTNENIEK